MAQTNCCRMKILMTMNRTTTPMMSRCCYLTTNRMNSTNSPTTNWTCRCSNLHSSLRRVK